MQLAAKTRLSLRRVIVFVRRGIRRVSKFPSAVTALASTSGTMITEYGSNSLFNETMSKRIAGCLAAHTTTQSQEVLTGSFFFQPVP